MEHVVRRRHDDAAVGEIAAQAHVLLRGERAQQHERIDRDLLDVHRLRHHLHPVIKTRQVEQLFRRALEALGLVADVGDEFAHGLRIDVFVLDDAVRQQAYRRQRRFQLVRCVGHKAAALFLRGVEPFSQEVEFLAEVGYLVAPAGNEPVAVVPARNYLY